MQKVSQLVQTQQAFNSNSFKNLSPVLKEAINDTMKLVKNEGNLLMNFENAIDKVAEFHNVKNATLKIDDRLIEFFNRVEGLEIHHQNQKFFFLNKNFFQHFWNQPNVAPCRRSTPKRPNNWLTFTKNLIYQHIHYLEKDHKMLETNYGHFFTKFTD